MSRAVLDRHLAECVDCRWYALDSARIRKAALRIETAPAPDVTEAVMRRVAESQKISWTAQVVRVVTALLGALQLIVAWPLLTVSGHMAHETRHIGAFSIALGVGLLYAAWRPHRAVGLMPAVISLSGAMLITCTLSLNDGMLPGHAELSHLVAPVAVSGLWWISRSGRAGLPARPHLRSVA